MKIVIGTGGSGGHLFPALEVANELKGKGHEIVFLGSFRKDIVQLERSSFHFKNLYAQGLALTDIKGFFLSIRSILKATYLAFKQLQVFKPDVVVGFGGYGAFPVVFSAWLLKRPTLIHEQNVKPGKANIICAQFVNRIAVSFKKSTTYFNKNKTILTGCPTRFKGHAPERKHILEHFQLKESKPIIFVLGGSQGSHYINEVFSQTAEYLKRDLDFQLIHVCGSKDFTQLQRKYSKINVPFALFDFLNEIDHAYKIADLVISRAGAVSITEIASACIPAILIPYPFAGQHQKENALILAKTNAARVIEEKDLSINKLKKNVLELLDRYKNREMVKGEYENIIQNNATSRLAAEALELAQCTAMS